MSSTIKIKRSAVAAKVPATTDVQLGELAINTYDGKLYLKKNDGTETIVEVGAGSAPVKRYAQFQGATDQAVTETTASMDLVNTLLSTGTGDFTLAADEVTVLNAGDYRVRVDYNHTDLNSSGGQRCAALVELQKNAANISGGAMLVYQRETTSNGNSTELLMTLAANDVLRVRLTRQEGSTNIATVAADCKLLIEKID